MIEELLKNILPQKPDIGINVKKQDTKGILYYDKRIDKHCIIIFDALGLPIELVYPNKENINFEMNETNLAFVDIKFYDVFMIIEPIVVTFLDKPAVQHFDESNEKDEGFLKVMYDKFMEKNEVKNLN